MNDIVTVTGKSRFGDICSLSFDWGVAVQPGQFVMVWAPGMEEIPLSLSSVKDVKSITFRM
ncbi:MAG: dihydroorotate dehydrogenase electron transfer subunit, partial [Candidatus Methanomethylophilaceae archaeon]|nr:dihydroorotate dehydrogenase electron transfer subunit [Candidatus Methanomethylophilaceae archaeon]